MTKRLTILGVLFSLAACLRAAYGQSPSLELTIAIAKAKASHVSTPKAGGATRSSPTRTVPPAVSEDSLPADAKPTPMSIVVEGLALLDLKPSDTFADIGCGFDCRWGYVAAKRYGCKVVAIEIDPELAASAKRYVEHAGLSHLITVKVGDAAKVKFTANKGSAYLWESDLAALKSKIEKFDKFVTFAHRVPGLKMRAVGSIYVYEKPQPLVAKMIYPTTATYNGREYTRAKSGCNCSMCQSLRAQLAPRMVMAPASTAAAQSQSAGRYVLMKKCVNGRCSMQRVWQAY